MRDVSWKAGVEELENIKTYAMGSLTPEEREFVQKINQKVEDYINEKSDHFLTLGEIGKLTALWRKYQHLKPFVFRFDPREKLKQLYYNRVAFIIWTVWRSFHLLGDEDLEGAALAAAEVLSPFQPPYPTEIKERAVEKFAVIMANTGYGSVDDLYGDFWEKRIFPYLEGVWEFKWVLEEV